MTLVVYTYNVRQNETKNVQIIQCVGNNKLYNRRKRIPHLFYESLLTEPQETNMFYFVYFENML